MKHTSISFYTLGCRLNQSETAVIQSGFERLGFKVVDAFHPSDIAVINTCTVTANGDTDTRRLVHKITRLNPDTRIALIGCQAQIQKAQLTKMPNIHWVVGNARKMDLAQIIQEEEKPEVPRILTPAIERKEFTVAFSGVDRDHTRANLKIQDGCDFFCSYCEIPYARGRARSRQFDDILLEARALAASGHKEIVLTGINVGTYQHQSRTIMDVIKALESIDNLKRIRISSIEPTTIPDELLDLMAQSSKLCRYLHIPLQSANDQILQAMNRQYTLRQFSALIHKAVKKIPDICIGTDIITGFPGEEEREFDLTLDALERFPIHYFHVFSYSQRLMAKSRRLSKAIPHDVIQKRSKILRALSLKKRQAFHKRFLNTIQNVLFEQQKEGWWSGLTDNFIRVKIESDRDLTNKIAAVRLTGIEGNNMMGDHI